MAGMETSIVNLVEPGDKVLICIAGVFGGRMKEVAERAGAQVTAINVPWGKVFSTEQVAQALDQHGPFKLVCIVQAETSTGALQPIAQDQQSGACGRSIATGGHGRLPGGTEVGRGWLANRCLLFRFSEVPVVPAWARTDHLRPGGSRSPEAPQDAGSELVP